MAAEPTLFDLVRQAPARQPGTSPTTPAVDEGMFRVPMGALHDVAQHPTFKSFERFFRRQGDAKMFNKDISRSKPFSFNIGGFNCPDSSAIMLTAYTLNAGRFSGIGASETRPLEHERMGTSWGFDLTVNGARERDCTFELDPLPITVTPQQYTGVGRTPQFYEVTAAQQFGNTSSAGLSLLPFSNTRFGSPDGPWTLWVLPKQSVAIGCSIFRPLSIPIAYVEASVSGFIMPATLMQKFIKQINP